MAAKAPQSPHCGSNSGGDGGIHNDSGDSSSSSMQTPTPTALRSGYHTVSCCEDLCSVCLSPFAQPCAKISFDFDQEGGEPPRKDKDTDKEMEKGKEKEKGEESEYPLRVVTRCKHVFHKSCLDKAKMRKAECPNCRAALTPIAPSVVVNETVDVRQSIVSNASRVRHNMQLAARRRQLSAAEPFQE